MADIYHARGWNYSYADDSIFETGLTNILGLLERNNIRGTLFVIASSLANPRKRELLQDAVRRGHEVASHSLTHPPNLKSLSDEQKRREIGESRQKLEQTLGVKVRGFRAPGYQIDRACVELLAEFGYEYDSSAFPTDAFADRLQVPVTSLTAPGRPFQESAFMELPLPDHRPSPFPFNPSYSLILGLNYFRWGLKRMIGRGTPLVLLFHLIDVANPLPRERLNGFKSRLFTLSIISREQKLARCKVMLDLVSRHYRLTTTSALISNLDHHVTIGGAEH